VYTFMANVIYTLWIYINGYCALKLSGFLNVVSVCKNMGNFERNRKQNSVPAPAGV
jgi:hypothetical protein